jgi:hypothetical protein
MTTTKHAKDPEGSAVQRRATGLAVARLADDAGLTGVPRIVL